MLNPFLYLSVLGSLISTSLSTWAGVPTVKTTSGTLRGSEQKGVISFKGIPFGQAPVGDLRWEAPKSYTSHTTLNATAIGPACVQQFPFMNRSLYESLFNKPPVPESEDCLFLNVWAPAQTKGMKRAVVFFIPGGGFIMGTASMPQLDGTSFAKNQDIVIITTNYRTNAFGFPGAEELFPERENLGLLDQELALRWVQENAEAFGGDPKKITIMGESAGSISVAYAIQRHLVNPPFRAAIMESGATLSKPPVPDFTVFDSLAKAVNCTQPPGPARLACMRAVSADAIRTWTNGPEGLALLPVADNSTVFTDPIQRILQKKTARVPILIGANQDEGSLFTLGLTSLSDFLNSTFGPFVTPDKVRGVYPGLNDSQVASTAFRDSFFLCPAELTANAFVRSVEQNVFRYMYGAVFADLQLFPGAGAWHGSEVPEIFGTFNTSTATLAEKTLSQTMQTIWGNFIRNPMESPAPNWERYVPGNQSQSLAKLAYQGNVELRDAVQPTPSGLDDGPCENFWNSLIAF